MSDKIALRQQKGKKNSQNKKTWKKAVSEIKITIKMFASAQTPNLTQYIVVFICVVLIGTNIFACYSNIVKIPYIYYVQFVFTHEIV